YLEQVAHLDLLTGIPLCTQTLSDIPGQAILSYVQAEHTDLIVLCSHGYTGLKRWAFGSVAQKIVRHSPAPVVVLREKNAESPLFSPEKAGPVRALVARDGSPFAEASLLPTAHLVAALSNSPTAGEIHLLRVVKPPSDPEERKYLAYDINIRQFNHSEA